MYISCPGQRVFLWQPSSVNPWGRVNIIGASLSEPHMGSKSVPRELSIYLSIYLCMRTSFRKCPHALIHRTVQFCRVCITSYHTKTMDPDTTIPVRDYSSKKEEQLLRRRVRERARRAAKL